MFAKGAMLALLLLSVVPSGCGGSASRPPGLATTSDVVSEQAHLSAIAHKCGESKTAVAVQVDAALKALRDHGLHGTRAELTEDLERLVTYAKKREKPPDCKGLLGATVLTFEEHSK